MSSQGASSSSRWRTPPDYATLQSARRGTWIERPCISGSKDAPGVVFSRRLGYDGDAATVSRDMSLEEFSVPDDAEVLPPGLFGAMYNAFPHLS